MELENIYRGDIIKCYGYKNAKFHISVDKSGRERYRYGKYDTIIKKNTVLIKVSDSKYIIMSELGMGSNSNLGLCEIQTFPTEEESLYVDEGSLKPYVYLENFKKIK